MAPKTKPYVYSGNSGYLFPDLGKLDTGDTVTLTAEQADQLGDEFQPKQVKKRAPRKAAAKKADPIQPETAAEAADTEGAKP